MTMTHTPASARISRRASLSGAPPKRPLVFSDGRCSLSIAQDTTDQRNRLALACWLALLTLTAIAFRKERYQTPGFIPPNSNEQYDRTDFQEPDPYAEPKHEVYDTPRRSTSGSRHDRGVRFASASPVHDVERPMAYSSPSYGSSGFQPTTSYTPAQQGPSRTMQLATSSYSDPCGLGPRSERDRADSKQTSTFAHPWWRSQRSADRTDTAKTLSLTPRVARHHRTVATGDPKEGLEVASALRLRSICSLWTLYILSPNVAFNCISHRNMKALSCLEPSFNKQGNGSWWI